MRQFFVIFFLVVWTNFAKKSQIKAETYAKKASRQFFFHAPQQPKRDAKLILTQNVIITVKLIATTFVPNTCIT